jgi:signal peptidase I
MTQKKEAGYTEGIIDWLKHIAIAVVIAVLTVNFVLQRSIVQKYSMEPTLHENDNILVEKISPKLKNYKRGDIITIKREDDETGKTIIKRIIGLPGDSIEIKDGKVLVNNEVLKEDYIKGSFTKPGNVDKYNKIKVPDKHVYVLGDNRTASIIDSRTEGPVSFEEIQGKAFIRIFPVKSIKFLK